MAPKSHIVAGVVRDSHGRPVPQARVFFSAGPSDLPDIAALTNEAGEFSLSTPADGTYRIECAAEGFSPASATVEAKPGAAPHVRITLRK